MAFALREKHRIYGRFVGTLPRCHNQNTCLGLPLLLNHEEVVIARKQRGVRVVIDSSVKERLSSPEMVTEYQQLLELNHKEMVSFPYFEFMDSRALR